MAHDQQTYGRGVTAAIIGFVVQLVLAVGVLLLAMWSKSSAVGVFSYYVFGGLPIWFILILIFNQHRLERIESLEAEQLATDDAQAAALFQERGDDLRIARKRLDTLYKWGLGSISVLLGLYLLVAGCVLVYTTYRGVTVKQVVKPAESNDEHAQPTREMVWEDLSSREVAETTLGEGVNANTLLFLAVGIALIAFLVARYIAGMTRVREWSLLRGAATYLMGNAVMAVVILIGVILVLFDNRLILAYMSIGLAVFLAVLGFEILALFMLNAYRPRRPDEPPRPAFDSRLLGWLASPESLGRIVSETINYQFGFEISKSWFYRLLGKALVPLCLFAIGTLFLVSSIVVVGPHEQAIVMRYGRIVPFDEENGQIAMPPGLHFKLPWPIDSAEKYAIGRVHQVSVGSGTAKRDYGTAILWTTEHTEGGREQLLLTAPTPRNIDNVADTGGNAAGASLVAAEVAVQFRVDDLVKFVTNVPDPADLERAARQRDTWNARAKRMSESLGRPVMPGPAEGEKVIDPCPVLTTIADRRVSEYFASHHIDDLLAAGRENAGEQLRDLIQQDANAANLGIKVVFVGVIGVHPPQESDVAESFHEQIGALQEKEAEIENARKDANKLLAEVAGSRAKALELSQEIETLNLLRQKVNDLRTANPNDQSLDEATAERDKQQQKVTVLLTAARGEAAKLILDAMAKRWQNPARERGAAAMFEAELAAYRRAKDYYTYKRYMLMLTKALQGPRKYFVPSNVKTSGVLRVELNLEDKKTLVPFGEDN